MILYLSRFALRGIYATSDRKCFEDDIDTLSSQRNGDESMYHGWEDFEPELDDL